MKSLLILRHAEAVTSVSGAPDEPRPLSEHGRGQAQRLGLWMAERGFNPDRIECSSAVRARETADIVATAAGWTAAVSEFDHLYTAPDHDLLEQARSQPAAVNEFLIVAHAPGVADLVGLLTTKGGRVGLVCEAATLAQVVLDIEHWSEIAPASGVLRVLAPPQ